MTRQPVVKGEDIEVLNSAGTQPPGNPLPIGAADCHFHIFDVRFPSASGKPVSPVGTVAHYRTLMRRLGLSRAVAVAPGTYSQSNDCLVDGLNQLGDAGRGVGIVQANVTLAELKDLHAKRVRGARLYLHRPAGRDQLRWSREDMVRLADLVANLGWHLEFVVSEGDKLVEAEDFLASLGKKAKIVIDHFAYVPQPEGVHHASAASLRRLLEQGNTWLKLSGQYYTSKVGFPTYADVDELARFMIGVRPDRMLWGSDWPHTNKTFPDAGRLIDQLVSWAPSPEMQKRILVDNPNEVYWYE